MISHIVLTGGSGYIGERLALAARARGHAVTILSRNPLHVGEGVRVLDWSLGETLPPGAIVAGMPSERQALIHLAHDWTETAPGPDEGAVNIAGTRTLLETVRAHGLGRFVFVSSQSARADAANVYGRTKWRIEQLLTSDRETSARVGLVYGGAPRGLYGLLRRLTARVPLLPMVDPLRTVQPIHVDEVCEGLLRLAQGTPTPDGWIGLAGPDAMPFGTVLRVFARELHGRRLRVLPIPLGLALFACDVLQRVPVGPKPDRERLLGLAGTREMPCAKHLAAMGLAVVPLVTGLRREPASRRALLAEGRALLRYVLGCRPSAALIRRYVRALPAVRESGALVLNPVARTWPALFRILEPLDPATAFGRRLALATSLAEASPEAKQVLVRPGRLRCIIVVAAGLAADALLLPVRLLLARLHR
jgi:nucleoside-diphosphate-sugar epimerase